MRLPFSILMGSILALIFAVSSLMSLVILTLTMPLGVQATTPAMTSFTAYLVAIASVLVATTCSYLVLKGSEKARMIYLVWTASAFVMSISISNDPSLVLVEATLGIIVLFFWFLPSSSQYLMKFSEDELAEVL